MKVWSSRPRLEITAMICDNDTNKGVTSTGLSVHPPVGANGVSHVAYHSYYHCLCVIIVIYYSLSCFQFRVLVLLLLVLCFS